MAWPCGFILVDKPSGLTSRDVVESIQRRLGPPQRRRRGRPRFRCGHAGTLDPLATGLLMVLVGSATRLSQFLLGHDKTYTTTIRFGETTDSLDSDGVVTDTVPADFSLEELDAAAAARRGVSSQVPPLISAIKRDGKTLHARVRAGETPEPPPARSVRLEEFRRLGELSPPDATGCCEVRFLISCSSGTYVRACARDLAADLGTVAHVTALRRESVGRFDVSDAFIPAPDLDEILVREALQPPQAALPEAPTLVVSSVEAAALRHGQQPDADWLQRLSSPPVALAQGREALWMAMDAAGDLVAVGKLCEDPEGSGAEILRTAVVFAAREEA